jgi:FkbM family methyltransferase
MATLPDGLGLYCASVGWVPCHVVQYLGKPFLYPTGSEVGVAIARGWEWDKVLRSLLERLVPEQQPVLCEVGSNIGASLLQILAAKPGARVLSFEPSDRFRAFLKYNLQLAGFTEVMVSPYLVGRESGRGFIHTDGTSGSIRQMPHLTSRQAAPVTTLDEVFRQGEPVSLIKTDTDGHDMEVLRGGEEVLRRDRPILFFEFCPMLMCSEPALDVAWLQTLDYMRFVCLNNLGYLVGVTTDAQQVVGWATEHLYCDVLTCAEGSVAQRRLESLSFALGPAE